MGSEGETMERRKPHYNISMSRRTRKPEREHEKMLEEKERELMHMRIDQKQKSLKELLIEGRCSLAQHFKEEEEEHSVVVRPAPADVEEEGDQRLILKRSMMRNYAQLVSHFIKVKQQSYIRSWTKSAMSFKLINHK